MEIINKTIKEIKPYEKNPRRNDQAVKYVVKSIENFGFKVPIVIDRDNVIVCGHTRYKAAKQLKYKEIPCIIADDLTEEQIKAFRLADNKVAEFAEWDIDLLNDEINDILNFDMLEFGFVEEDKNDVSRKYDEAVSGSLSKKFIMPPFSILDARNGEWRKRKKRWMEFVESEKGRDDSLLGKGLYDLSKATGCSLNGTSVFDPVLTEVLVNWYSPRGGKILDPFAGGSVRGIVSSVLDRKYYGNDLRPEQIDENIKQASPLIGRKNVFGNDFEMPQWTVGDSLNIDELIPERDFDMLLTCPPYADLEQYSDDPADLSNMEYEEFLKIYREIFKKSIDMLAENAFIAVVVGEVRDKHGYYRNFIGDTIDALKDAGAHYYNEIILITMGGTLPLRAGKVFEASRKVSNTHQKALIFLKSNGDKDSLNDYLNEFDKTKEVTEMKKNILIFLKGNSKLAKNDIENYDFEIF